jgi:hypothetical protein
MKHSVSKGSDTSKRRDLIEFGIILKREFKGMLFREQFVVKRDRKRFTLSKRKRKLFAQSSSSQHVGARAGVRMRFLKGDISGSI